MSMALEEGFKDAKMMTQKFAFALVSARSLEMRHRNWIRRTGHLLRSHRQSSSRRKYCKDVSLCLLWTCFADQIPPRPSTFNIDDAYTDELMIDGVFSRLVVQPESPSSKYSNTGSSSKLRSANSSKVSALNASLSEYDAFIEAQKPFTVDSKLAALHNEA